MGIRLVCLDMDGVLTRERNFWLALHEVWGTLEEGKALTERYLHTDYPKLVDEVCGRLWKGKDEKAFLDLVQRVPYSDGISEFFAALRELTAPNGDRIPNAIITSGPYELADRIKTEFPVDFLFANQLEFHDHRVTGSFQWPVGAGTDAKVRIIEHLCASLEILPQEVLYVGDSAADIDAFRIVGISIAFNANNEELKRAATHVVDSDDLRAVIPILPQTR